MLIDLINEDRVSAVSVAPGAGGPGEETSWLARCTAMTSFEVTAKEIADKEIGLWKSRTVPLPKTDDPLVEWKLCGDKNVGPFLARVGSSQEVEGGLVVSLNLSSVSFIQPSLLPLPLLITLPLSPSLAQGQTLTVSIPPHTPSHAGHRYR
jgi:hypothetical protein